ncbi:MAG TPA: hypothetical protein VFV38_51065 [Ktedonobacteraceae bacterium]|nr:hypothetical protein [Ktedonobacteraceae bacterium]
MAKSIWVAGSEVLVAIGSFFATLWAILIDVFREYYYYWAERVLPQLKMFAQEAWIKLDKVAIPIKRAAKKAWRELRRYLLKQTLDVLQISPNHWAYKIISWFMPSETDFSRVIRTEEQVDVPYEDLPADVREEILRRQQIRQMDIVKTRDEEMELVS